MGPLRLNCFRQVKETGGRTRSCAHTYLVADQLASSPEEEGDTAAMFRVCSTA